MNAPVDPCGLASVVQCASCFFWRIDTGLVVHSEGKLLKETLDNDRNVTFPYKDSKQRLQELELVLVTWKTMLEITPPPTWLLALPDIKPWPSHQFLDPLWYPDLVNSPSHPRWLK